MARRPNYGQERADRARRKAARRDERLANKAERRDKGQSPELAALAVEHADVVTAGAGLDVSMPSEPAAMIRLSQALTFVCGADHPTTLAVRRAAESGDGDDVKQAHLLFQRLTPENRHAALTIAASRHGIQLS